MRAALNSFNQGFEKTKVLFGIYDHLIQTVHLPEDEVSDLLRAQIVYAVSNLDRLLHELVRLGILEIFAETRHSTEKLLREPFKANTVISIMKALKSNMPPSSAGELPENIINAEVTERLGFKAFQTGDKVKDALSYIWTEGHKMVVLANRMGLPGATDNDRQKYLEQTLGAIVDRRNQIVHEGDLDINGNRRGISKHDTVDSIEFIQNLGNAIYKEVTSAICYC